MQRFTDEELESRLLQTFPPVQVETGVSRTRISLLIKRHDGYCRNHCCLGHLSRTTAGSVNLKPPPRLKTDISFSQFESSYETPTNQQHAPTTCFYVLNDKSIKNVNVNSSQAGITRLRARLVCVNREIQMREIRLTLN